MCSKYLLRRYKLPCGQVFGPYLQYLLSRAAGLVPLSAKTAQEGRSIRQYAHQSLQVERTMTTFGQCWKVLSRFRLDLYPTWTRFKWFEDVSSVRPTGLGVHLLGDCPPPQLWSQQLYAEGPDPGAHWPALAFEPCSGHALNQQEQKHFTTVHFRCPSKSIKGSAPNAI